MAGDADARSARWPRCRASRSAPICRAWSTDRVRLRAGGPRGRRARGARHAPGAGAAGGRRGAARSGARQLRTACRACSTSASISRAEFDRATAEQRQADARVGEIRATIERKTIRAPFSGVLGIRHVNLGQYLSGGDPLVTLQSLNPIYVNFGVPQQAIGAGAGRPQRPRHARTIAPASSSPDASPRSTRSSTKRRGTCRCRRRSRTRTASCGPACSCRPRSSSARRAPSSRCRRRRSATRRTATRCSSSPT